MEKADTIFAIEIKSSQSAKNDILSISLIFRKNLPKILSVLFSMQAKHYCLLEMNP